MTRLVFTFVFFSLVLYSCKKDSEHIILTDNTAPYYNEIPQVTLQNYINRLFIDLIGREPLNAEMESEESTFRASAISTESRELLIEKLQSNTDYIPGDSSYNFAYYNRLYELCKARTLEAASNDYMRGEASNVLYAASQDSIAGDSLNFVIKKQEAKNYYEVIDCEEDYRMDSIEISGVFAQMLYNGVYDQINMNSFNFINAAFNDLFARFPTSNEFDQAYQMVEFNRPATLMGKSGQNKGDLIDILVNSKEFYEGIIVWQYYNLLAREPTAHESFTAMQTFFDTHNMQQVQMDIMKTDEYANFK